MEILKQTKLVLEEGNFGLGVYLFHSLLNSNKNFDFPILIKTELLGVYMMQLIAFAKLVSKEALSSNINS